ncbi:hypothetical protein KBB96_09960 [Luteolibacter ambystomatis]|uniref:Uncharacterized protein n=1 Tax=Luteolibacter ambystomatis TaxID=2824561 RepID=A0A975J360_9BACT|nr:hypothetical protein [Luteolibacter ambystomatis]QUE53205.1 hypothetical protein KBB96_09960 [Luteolibacter ambystomatis]
MIKAGKKVRLVRIGPSSGHATTMEIEFRTETHGLSNAAVSYWMASYKIAEGSEGWMEVAGMGRDKRARRMAELAVLEAEVSDLRRKLDAAEAKLRRLKALVASVYDSCGSPFQVVSFQSEGFIECDRFTW